MREELEQCFPCLWTRAGSAALWLEAGIGVPSYFWVCKTATHQLCDLGQTSNLCGPWFPHLETLDDNVVMVKLGNT